MHIAIWIFTLIGLALWTLLAWGLHSLLSIDPKWLDDVEALVKNVPYAEVIERWFPGWQQLLGVAMAASLLAALLPVIKLARMQPASLIKIFADER